MNKTIIICCPGDNFTGRFIRNLTYLIRHLNSKGFDVLFSSIYSRNIYEVRNRCLLGKPEKGQDQKLFDGEKYDYILWIDNDIIFTPEDFEKLYKGKQC